MLVHDHGAGFHPPNGQSTRRIRLTPPLGVVAWSFFWAHFGLRRRPRCSAAFANAASKVRTQAEHATARARTALATAAAIVVVRQRVHARAAAQRMTCVAHEPTRSAAARRRRVRRLRARLRTCPTVLYVARQVETPVRAERGRRHAF